MLGIVRGEVLGIEIMAIGRGYFTDPTGGNISQEESLSSLGEAGTKLKSNTSIVQEITKGFVRKERMQCLGSRRCFLDW